MSAQFILDESYASVWPDATVPGIISQLHAFANRDQFKHLMNKARSQPAHRWGWIADPRNMSAISQQVQQWLAHDWNEQVCRAGRQAVSTVTSANITGRLATQQCAEQTLAQAERYGLAPVYYESLAAARLGVAQRCAARNTLALGRALGAPAARAQVLS